MFILLNCSYTIHMIISACPLFQSVSFSPSYTLSGGIFLALLHSFLLHCQAAAAAAVSTLLPLSAHNLVLLATPPLSHTLHMAVRMPRASACLRARPLSTHTSCLPWVLLPLLYLCRLQHKSWVHSV